MNLNFLMFHLNLTYLMNPKYLNFHSFLMNH